MDSLPVDKKPHRKSHQHTLVLPFVMVLITQIVLTSRDLVVFHARKQRAIEQNAQASAILKQSALQVQALEKLQVDLIKASESDPIIKKITDDYFPKNQLPSH